MAGIPSLDLNLFLSADEAKKQLFVQQLGQAYENIGFIALKNHQIPEGLIEELYEQNSKFFNLPIEIKEKYSIAGLSGQRGYTSFGKEHAKGMSQGDLKEFWHFGQFVENDDELEKKYPQNVSVSELPSYLETGKKAYKSLEKTGITILKAIAIYLGLEENFFEKHVVNGNSILRPIHYPPLKTKPNGAVRAGAHEDINLITLLVGASAEGLEVLNKQNEWIPVTAIEDHIIVNVGDMLQRLTNNKLRSTTHRVVNPPENNWNTSRYSVPFFLHPKADMPLNCLPNTIQEAGKKLYSDITAGEYLEERLKEIGLM